MSPLRTDGERACSDTVWKQSGNWGRSMPCSRRGAVEREGKWWCTQHDPERVKTRRDASWRKFQLEAAVNNKRSAFERACVAFDGPLPEPLNSIRAEWQATIAAQRAAEGEKP